MKNHFDATQADFLAVLELCLRNPRIIDERSVCRTQIIDCDQAIAISDDDLAMRAGNGSVGDLEINCITAAKKVGAVLELNFPSVRPVWVHDQSVHLTQGVRVASGQLIDKRTEPYKQQMRSSPDPDKARRRRARRCSLFSTG